MSQPVTVHAYPTAPTTQPNILSPHIRGYKLEGVWPPLFWGPERLPEIERKVRAVPWAQKLFSSLIQEANAVCCDTPNLPIEPVGWRHDYYSPETAEHLFFNPNKAIHLDPCNQVEWTGEAFHRAWVLQVHERTYRLMRNLASMYRITGEQRYGSWVAQGLAKALDMFTHTDFRAANKHHALYYQPLYDAQVLALIANTCALLQGTSVYTNELHAAITTTIFEASIPFQISFLEGRGAHNMTCYVGAALAFAGSLLGRSDWLNMAIYHPTGGFCAMLRDGLARDAQGKSDGFWNESIFYHYYAVCPLISMYALMQSKTWPHAQVSVSEVTADPTTAHTLMQMLLAPVKMADSQLKLPLFGDLGAPRQMKVSLYKHLYEMSTGVITDNALKVTLGAIIHNGASRASLESLAFGPDHVGSTTFTPVSVHLPAAGVVLLRNDSLQAHLKCGMPHRGHDHEDKLSFGLTAFDTPVVADLGTAGYAAREFYAYCRSAVSHSTIIVDDNEKQTVEAVTLTSAVTDQEAEAELYFGPEERRIQRHIVLDSTFVYLHDICSAPELHTYTCLIHPYGSAAVIYAEEAVAGSDNRSLPETGAFAFFTNRHTFTSNGAVCIDWQVFTDLWLRGWFWANVPMSCTLATSPGNPRPDIRTSLALRCNGAEVVIKTALEVYREVPQMMCPPWEQFGLVAVTRTDA